MNNKGFTLVEVISVIGILLLIATITVPSIILMQNNNKNKNYDKLIDTIITSSENYYHTKLEPLEKGQSCYIKLQALANNNLIKTPIINPKTDDKISLDEYVVLTKTTNNDIKYKYDSSISGLDQCKLKVIHTAEDDINDELKDNIHLTIYVNNDMYQTVSSKFNELKNTNPKIDYDINLINETNEVEQKYVKETKAPKNNRNKCAAVVGKYAVSTSPPVDNMATAYHTEIFNIYDGSFKKTFGDTDVVSNYFEDYLPYRIWRNDVNSVFTLDRNNKILYLTHFYGVVTWLPDSVSGYSSRTWKWDFSNTYDNFFDLTPVSPPTNYSIDDVVSTYHLFEYSTTNNTNPVVYYEPYNNEELTSSQMRSIIMNNTEFDEVKKTNKLFVFYTNKYIKYDDNIYGLIYNLKNSSNDYPCFYTIWFKDVNTTNYTINTVHNVIDDKINYYILINNKDNDYEFTISDDAKNKINEYNHVLIYANDDIKSNFNETQNTVEAGYKDVDVILSDIIDKITNEK